MKDHNFEDVFTPEILSKLFPEDRTDKFFDALLGDAAEGTYDISLDFSGQNRDRLIFQFCLKQRPGKCLACHLTYGLPQVFSRHPVINIKGLFREIGELLREQVRCTDWRIGDTQEISGGFHTIPLFISLET